MSMANCQLASVSDVGRDAWAAFVDAHPDATVYHSPEWTDVLAEALGFAPRHLFAIDGSGICGLLPLFSRTGRRFSSSPFRDRGGVLAAEDSVRDFLLASLLDKVGRGEVQGVEIKSNLGPGPDLDEAPGYLLHEPLVVSEVALQGDEETLWRGLNNKVRGKVRQARRAGLELAVPVEKGAERAFYELFWTTRRRLGVPSYGPGLFTAIRKHMVPAGKARFLYAMSGGEAVAGMVVFIGGGRMIDAYAASDPGALSLRPNDFLKWEAISTALGMGCDVYDFGADTPAQEALLSFKRKWGARQRPVRVLVGGGMDCGGEFGGSGMARLAGRVLPRLPGPLFKAASSFAVWWLGKGI